MEAPKEDNLRIVRGQIIDELSKYLSTKLPHEIKTKVIADYVLTFETEFNNLNLEDIDELAKEILASSNPNEIINPSK